MAGVKATAFAPATTGNVGVGFDVLGLALDMIGDTVTVMKAKDPGVVITKITGPELPLDPLQNTATAGIVKLLKDAKADFGVRVAIKKGIPLGSGLGGSAASAVAGIVAANRLLPKPYPRSELMEYALIGEKVATGSVHGDNVAPCLFGGLMLVRSLDPVNVVSLPVPKALRVVVALPNARLDTKEARAVLKPDVSLTDFVGQISRLAGFIAGCYENDLELLSSSFEDIVIEPQRAHLIKGFRAVKEAALANGALGCSISGAGPAVFALATEKTAPKMKSAMVTTFEKAGAGPAKAWVSRINAKGARAL